MFSKPRFDFGELFVCSRFWESIVYSTFSVSLLRRVLTLDPPLPRTKYKWYANQPRFFPGSSGAVQRLSLQHLTKLGSMFHSQKNNPNDLCERKGENKRQVAAPRGIFQPHRKLGLCPWNARGTCRVSPESSVFWELVRAPCHCFIWSFIHNHKINQWAG